MVGWWLALANVLLILLAFHAGAKADTARQREVWRRNAEEVRRLRRERQWLAAEGERYREAVRRWERLLRSSSPADETVDETVDDHPPGGFPPVAA